MTKTTRFRLLGAGLFFGVMTSAINHGLGPYPEYASKVLGNSWAWLLAGFLAAWAAQSWRAAAARGWTLLYAAVAGYYITDLLSGTYTNEFAAAAPGTTMTTLDTQGMVIDVIAYLVVSTLTGAALASLVVGIRRRGVIGLLSALALPAFIAKMALDRHRAALAWPPDPVMATVSHAVLWAATGVGILVLIARVPARRSPERRA